MIEYKKHYGLTDEELINYPTVFADDLLKGHVALVSGAGTGIGKGIATLFARLGADLVICGRNEERLEKSAEFLRGFGGRVVTDILTIRDPLKVEALMDKVWQEYGRLDYLINNAGGQFAQNAIDISYKGWQAVIDTNLNGTWYMMQNAAKRWRDTDEPGSIVTVTADLWRGINQMSHTTASRAGVIYLAKNLAVEWAPFNIRVNTVAAGSIESSGFNNYGDEAHESLFKPGLMKRPGHVMDIAEACVYASAHSGNYITGETITVGGGMSLWGEFWPAGKPDYFKGPGEE
ncbi:MAG: SDR family oxidoreductase [Pseudomonadales bacterium]|nr:SDR family oxidoreductase [Pseudomonadales bacterium]